MLNRRLIPLLLGFSFNSSTRAFTLPTMVRRAKASKAGEVPESSMPSDTNEVVGRKRSRRIPAAAVKAEVAKESEEIESAPVKKKRQGKAKAETVKVARVIPDRETISRGLTVRSALLPPSEPHVRVISWNVCGIRSLLKKEESKSALAQMVDREKPHILFFQETRLQTHHVEEIKAELQELLPLYQSHWLCSVSKKGYSGTAALVLGPGADGSESAYRGAISVTNGIGQEEGDAEGRVLCVELEKAYVVTAYTPNAGEKLKRLDFRTETWDKACAQYLASLERRKPVIFTGDLNVAHEDCDFFNPHERRMLKSACTTPQERNSFAENYLTGNGFIDTFRYRYPSATGVYSYWSIRAGNRPFNRGLRLDYVLTSGSLKDGIHDAFILDGDTVGVSDHCPVGAVVRLPK